MMYFDTFLPNSNNFHKKLVIIVIGNEEKWTDFISNIMLKCAGIFCENVTYFFVNTGKTENMSWFQFGRF